MPDVFLGSAGFEMKLRFYTTSGCHLCEDAWELLLQWANRRLVTLDVDAVEIADDPKLMQQYGIRIPVIAVGRDELDCPFDEIALEAFLAPRLGE